MDSSFAYVVGRYDAPKGDVMFSSRYSNGTFFTYRGTCTVYKVPSGRYYLARADLESDKILWARSGVDLATVNVEQGKINYFGDIDIRINAIGDSRSMPSIVNADIHEVYMRIERPANASITVRDNSEAVKNAIREKYPLLAKELDTLFVYTPAQ
jgi:hypothetical protein